LEQSDIGLEHGKVEQINQFLHNALS